MKISSKIFAIYKPKGPTSRQVLNQIQKITGERHIGHAGTLDPLASGVLVIGIGREATKKLGEVVKKEKEYIAKMKLGETSTTDDEEGTKKQNIESRILNLEEILEITKTFIGKIQQVPPSYSAVKIKGKEAYKRVRRGEKIEMKPREVEIKEIEILGYEYIGSTKSGEGGAYLTLRVVTGPGVYIRSLARDIGEKLGVGGYLAELERTRVGDFRKENAVVVEPSSPILNTVLK